MSGIAPRIEERKLLSIAGELRSQSDQLRGLVCQLQRQVSIVLERIRNQFRQAHGFEKARCNAARTCCSETGEERQSRPQGVTSCRMRIVGKRVEKQVSGAVPRQMLGGRNARRKNEPLWRYFF